MPYGFPNVESLLRDGGQFDLLDFLSQGKGDLWKSLRDNTISQDKLKKIVNRQIKVCDELYSVALAVYSGRLSNLIPMMGSNPRTEVIV